MHDWDVVAYLTYLAVKRNVAANTQKQALNALVFLYRNVLDRPLGDVTSAVRACPRSCLWFLHRMRSEIFLSAYAALIS